MNPPAQPMRLTIRSWKVLLGLAGAFVLLMWLSYPRPNFWPAAHVALVPLTLIALRASTWKQAARWAYLAGFAWWAVGMLWLGDVASIGYLALALYLAIYPLAFAVVLRSVDRATRWPCAITLPIVWVGLEYLRGSVMTWNGFPWFLQGHSQPTLMIQIADFAGAYGVSFVVAMTSGVAIDLLGRPLTMRRVGWWRSAQAPVMLWLVVLIGTLGYGFARLAEHDSLQDPALDPPGAITVAIVQTDIPLSNKLRRTPEQNAADFAELKRLTLEAARGNPTPELIVWPETVVPKAINNDIVYLGERITADLLQRVPPEKQADDEGIAFWSQFGKYRRGVESIARQTGAWIIGGANGHPEPTIDREGFAHLPRTNAAYLLAPDGRLVERYDKIHRVPFGEFVPLIERGGWVRRLVLALTPYSDNYQALQAGFKYNVLPMQRPAPQPPLNVAAPICFEDVVSYVCRRLCHEDGEKRVQLMVNLTNDGWYPGWAQGPQHEQIARFRCIENRVPMARAVNRGVSSFIDSSGRIIKRVVVDGETQMVAGTAVEKLMLDDRSTFFGARGDVFALVCATLTPLLWVASLATGRRKGSPSP